MSLSAEEMLLEKDIPGCRDVVRELHLRKCSRFQTISKVKECLSDSMFEKSVHLTKRYHHESPKI